MEKGQFLGMIFPLERYRKTNECCKTCNKVHVTKRIITSEKSNNSTWIKVIHQHFLFSCKNGFPELVVD